MRVSEGISVSYYVLSEEWQSFAKSCCEIHIKQIHVNSRQGILNGVLSRWVSSFYLKWMIRFYLLANSRDIFWIIETQFFLGESVRVWKVQMRIQKGFGPIVNSLLQRLLACKGTILHVIHILIQLCMCLNLLHF